MLSFPFHKTKLFAEITSKNSNLSDLESLYLLSLYASIWNALSMKFFGSKLIFVPLKYIVLIYSSDRSEKLIAWTFIHFNWPFYFFRFFHSIAALWTIWAITIARAFNVPGAPPAEPYDMPKAFGRVSFPALFHILKCTEFLVKFLAFPLIPRNV